MQQSPASHGVCPRDMRISARLSVSRFHDRMRGSRPVVLLWITNVALHACLGECVCFPFGEASVCFGKRSPVKGR